MAQASARIDTLSAQARNIGDVAGAITRITSQTAVSNLKCNALS